MICSGVEKRCAGRRGGDVDRKGDVVAGRRGQTTVISCSCKFVVAPKDSESDFMKEVALVRGFLSESCSEEEGGPVPAALQAHRERSLQLVGGRWQSCGNDQ